MENKQIILSVGQCGFDNQSLKGFVNKINCDLATASTSKEALALIKSNDYKLIFVNRIFDLDGSSGMNFIKNIKESFPKVKVLLISNYQDKQELAVSCGALKGFGKNDLNQKTLELLKSYL